MQGETSPTGALKNCTEIYMITCRLSSCKTNVNSCAPVLLIILERGCSSIGGKNVLCTITSPSASKYFT